MANMRRDPAKEAFWRDAVGRQVRSGLSVREFCRRNGLSEPSFYERRRTYQERDAQRPTPAPAFVSVMVRDELFATEEVKTETGIVIEMRGGRALRLPGSMSARQVAELVRALEAGGVTP